MSETTALITAEELSTIPPEQGKEEEAGMTSPEDDPLSSKVEVKFLQNHPSQASKNAAEPSSIFQQGNEKASIFCSLPPAWTTSDVAASFTHIAPDLRKYQNQGFLYPSQAAKSAAEPFSIFEHGKEKASIFCSLPPAWTTSDVEASFTHIQPDLRKYQNQGFLYPSQAAKSAAEPFSIFEHGKEKASIFCSLPPAWTTSDVEASFTHIQPDLQKYQNQGFLYPSQAAKSAAEPFSIFEQGKEKASIFSSLPPAWTTSDVEASFTHIQPDLQKYQNQGFLYPSQAEKSAAESSSIFQQGKEKASIFCSLPPAGTTLDVDDAVKGFFYPSKASKSAAEPSSIFEQGKEKAGTTSDVEDPFAHLLPANSLEKFSPKASRMAAELASILQRREGMSEEEHLEELIKFASRPLPIPKCYGIALDTDMKKMKRGRCKYDFFKEEAISFLEGIGGSLWAEKYGGQYEVAVGNVFLCWLLEDELIVIKGKSEVLGVMAVCEDNRFDRPFFEPDPSPPPQQFGFSWRPDPFNSFQSC